MRRIKKFFRDNRGAMEFGFVVGTGVVIVFQHKCIMEALDIIHENGLSDKIAA